MSRIATMTLVTLAGFALATGCGDDETGADGGAGGGTVTGTSTGTATATTGGPVGPATGPTSTTTTAAGGGSQGCVDEQAALILAASLTPQNGLGACTAQQVIDASIGCVGANSSMAACDAVGMACTDCLFGAMGATHIPAVVPISDTSVIVASRSCEAQVTGLPQCAAPVTSLYMCVFSACGNCADGSQERDDCFSDVQADGGACDGIVIPMECSDILTRPAADLDPLCRGTVMPPTFESQFTAVGTYVCGPPPA